MKIERKIVEFEIKRVHENGEFEGHAAVYENVDLGGDKFMPGVFASSIKKNKGKVPILLDHIPSVMTNAGFNESAIEDGKGLFVKGKLNLEKQAGREARAMMQQAKDMGIKVALSVGFTIAEGGVSFIKGIREISEAKLWEYSIVIWGMNPKARVSAVKSLKEITDPDEILYKKKFIEQILRDADCSLTEAKRAVSVLFLRDVEPDEEETATLKSLTELVTGNTEQLKLS